MEIGKSITVKKSMKVILSQTENEITIENNDTTD